MKIAKLEIYGFRGISSGIVNFADFNVLIGANNSGKTTVIEALALLLGRHRLVRELTEHDFYGSDPQPADRIKIIATVTGFEPNDPARHTSWVRGIPKWIDARTGKLKTEQGGEDDRLAYQIAFCARFDRESLEVETARYFLDDPEQDDPFSDNASVTPLSAFVVKELGFFLVPASRTWDRMISFGSELFRRTVAYVGGKPAEAVLEERERLRHPQKPLEEDEKLRNLVGEVNQDIQSLFGKSSKLKLRLTSTDSAGVGVLIRDFY